MVELRTAGGVERVTDEEWEERVRAGRVDAATLVRVPAVTGDRFVEAAELASWRALREDAERRMRLASAVPPLAIALVVGLQIRIYLWSHLPEVNGWLSRWTLNFAPLVFENRELWRPVTAGLLQVEFLHAGTNLLWAFFAGFLLERTLGRAHVLVIFLSAVLVGAAFSDFGSPWSSSLGSSGGVFGLIAALVTFGIVRSELVASRWSAAVGVFLLPYLVLTFWSGLSSEGVDNWCHFGGLVTGSVLGLLLDPPLAERRRGWNRGVYALTAALVLGGWAVIGLAGPRVEPLFDERHATETVRRRGRARRDPPAEPAYRALAYSVPGGWVPDRDLTGRTSWASPAGGRRFGVRAEPSDRARPADEVLAAAAESLRADWPAAVVTGPDDDRLAGREARRLRIETGGADPRVVELRIVTRGAWTLSAAWEVEAAAEARLAPLRDRLLAGVTWGDPEELLSAREDHARHPSPETRRTLAAAEAAVGERAEVERLHRELLAVPDADAWRAVLADQLVLGDGADALGATLDALFASDPDGKTLAAAVDAADVSGDAELATGLAILAWERSPGERALKRVRRARGLSTELVDGRPWAQAIDPVTRTPRPAAAPPPLERASARAAGRAWTATRAVLSAALADHLAAGDPAALADLSVLAQGDDRATGEALALLVDEAVADPPPAWLPPEAAAAAHAHRDWLLARRPAPAESP